MQNRISETNRTFFEQVLEFMINKRVIMDVSQKGKQISLTNLSKLVLRTSGESQIVFIQSLIWNSIDSYYMTLVYVMAFIKNKGIDMTSFTKNVQWLAESFYKEGAIEYFESCNQDSIKNALQVFI